MYEDIIKASQELADKRKEEDSKLQQEDKMLEQTDLINKTNVEVAKQLVKFMHEYLTSVEVNNMPEDLAKSEDIEEMVDKLEKLITVNATNSGNFVKSLDTGISELISAVEKLNETTSDKSDETEYYDQMCQDLRNVQQAIVDANKAVLNNDKTKDVISSLKNLEKAVKGLKLAPSISVSPTPVDLKGIEKAISEIPSKIVIPETVIPTQDNSDLMSAINQTTEAIRNIVFPVAEFPTTIKVANSDGAILDGTTSTTKATVKSVNTQVTSADNGLVTNAVLHGKTTGGGGGFVDVKVNPSGALTTDATISGNVSTEAAIYDKRLDDTSTANAIYIGEAAVGVATSAASWRVKRLDISSGLVVEYAGTGTFNQIWDNRTSLTYN